MRPQRENKFNYTDMRYKVKYYMDNEYAVFEISLDDNYREKRTSVFKGSLADCEAWIRLHESGYMD